MNNSVEEWRPVKDWEGRYAVSTHGRVRNTKTGLIRKTPTGKNGYPIVGLCRGTAKESVGVHLIMARAFLRKPHCRRPQVNHKDGVKTNNHISNLEWITQAKNLEHAWRIGLREDARQTAVRIHRTLTDEQVKRIRETYLKTPRTMKSIADEFGTWKGTVHRIVHGVGVHATI